MFNRFPISAAIVASSALSVAPAARADYSPPVRLRIHKVIVAHKTAPASTPKRPMRASRQRRVAVFGLDHVVIFNDVGDAAVRRLVEVRAPCRENHAWQALLPRTLFKLCRKASDEVGRHDLLVGVLQHYRRMCTRKGKRACRAWRAKLFAGMTIEHARRLSEDLVAQQLGTRLCREELEKGLTITRGMRIYQTQTELIAKLHRHGFEVWLVTTAPQPVALALAKRLGVAPGHVIGMELERATRKRRKRRSRRARGPDRPRYSDELVEPIPIGKGKVAAIKKRIGAQPALVIGGGADDRQMLARARGLAVIIDRGATENKQLAKAKGWAIEPAFIAAAKLPRCGTAEKPPAHMQQSAPIVCERNQTLVVKRRWIRAQKTPAIIARGQCNLALVDCWIAATVAIAASRDADVKLDHCQVFGSRIAISAQNNARVHATRSEIHGRIKKSGDADFHDEGQNRRYR